MDGVNAMYRMRLPEFESFDRIELAIVPRYKTSGLSGDEWRQGIAIRFYFKGEVVHEEQSNNMRNAILMLGHHWVTAQEPIPERIIELENTKCMQPSCPEDAVGKYRIKKEFSDRGEEIAEDENRGFVYFRQFCAKHAMRGDCGRDDSDKNYEPIGPLRPEDSTNTEESPSAFGGVLRINPNWDVE